MHKIPHRLLPLLHRIFDVFKSDLGSGAGLVRFFFDPFGVDPVRLWVANVFSCGSRNFEPAMISIYYYDSEVLLLNKCCYRYMFTALFYSYSILLVIYSDEVCTDRETLA